MIASSIKTYLPQICLSLESSCNTDQGSPQIWLDCTQSRSQIDLQIYQFKLAHNLTDKDTIIVSDSRNLFGVYLDPYEDLDDILGIAQSVHLHGEAYVKFLDWNVFHSEELFNKAYQGRYDSFYDFGYEHYEDNLQYWHPASEDFDYEEYARDDLLSGSYDWIDGYVFEKQ